MPVDYYNNKHTLVIIMTKRISKQETKHKKNNKKEIIQKFKYAKKKKNSK